MSKKRSQFSVVQANKNNCGGRLACSPTLKELNSVVHVAGIAQSRARPVLGKKCARKKDGSCDINHRL